MVPLDYSILKTIIYFDCLDRALTATEVYFYLANITTSDAVHCAFVDVLKALERGVMLRTEYIDEKNGYYFLKGRGHLYEERIERLKTADRLWKKMRRIARWMQMTPYLRLVMASGSLGMEHMTADSDLDVLVVVKRGRIWTGRFFLTAFMHLLGVRRHGRYIAGRVCLNHYITDQSLSIPFRSLYNAMTYAQLVPIYERQNKKPATKEDLLRDSSAVLENDPELPSTDKYSRQKNAVKALNGSNYFNRFQEANIWIKNYLPHWRPGCKSLRTIEPGRFLVSAAILLEWCLDSVWGGLLERLLRRVQLKRIERRPETRAAGGRVRADDMMLEFHPNSPEKIIINRFNAKMRELGVSLRDEPDSGLA